MAKTVNEAKLATRTARAGLPEGIHFRSIDENVHLSYRRGKRGGTWGLRVYCGDGQYRRERLGVADDIIEEGNLTFDAAVKAARAKVTAWRKKEAARAAGPIATVRSAVESYVEMRDRRESLHQGRAVRSSASHKLNAHVLCNEELAATELHRLTVAELAKWRKSLNGSAASRQRVVNDFKAALNDCAPTAETKLIIKEGLAAPKGEGRSQGEGDDVECKLLTDAQTRSLLKTLRHTGDEDLYLLSLVLASTGTRFAQARLLKVKDVQIDRLRIVMPSSRKGRSDSRRRDAVPIPVGQDIIDALMPIIAGRGPNEVLFQRWRHRQVAPGQWVRDSRGPWKTASELSRPIRAAIEAAGLPASTSAYSFRHSSIVRSLREGLPVRLVAQLHDSSIQMIEAAYTRFMADALEDVARKAIVPMVTEDRGDNVVPMEAHRG